MTHVNDTKQAPFASLIIVNYNGADWLPECIESALATLPPGCEIVVVDNASTDTSRDVLARYADAIRLVPVLRNLGFGRACNLGVAAARGDLLIFLNPDVVFPAGWFEPLAAAARSDPQIGLLCPMLLSPGSACPPFHPPLWEQRALLPGCGLTARRSAWLSIGGFDEAFFLYWEDTELCWRARRLGWRLVHVRNSAIYHQQSAITSAYGRWDAERARGSLYAYLKLRSWPLVVAYAMYLLAVTGVKSLRWPTLAPALARAWLWNIAHLRQTLRARSRLFRQLSG